MSFPVQHEKCVTCGRPHDGTVVGHHDSSSGARVWWCSRECFENRFEPVGTSRALSRFAEAYSKEFGEQGYGPAEMIDFVVNNAALSDLEQPLHGMSGLIKWYRSRADFLEQHEAEELSIRTWLKMVDKDG